MSLVYLDHAATTPCDPAVVEAMRPYFQERFGNPSSPHAAGQRCRSAVESARETMARAIGARPSEIIFTSGATESNNHVLFASALAHFAKGRHLVIGAIEHHSVLESARRLGKLGFEISFVMPDARGTIAPGAVEEALRKDTILIAVQHANNEIGTIQPVGEIGRLARSRNILFLVDAAQTVGHIPVDVAACSCDFLSCSAHKFYGPQGVGLLYVRDGVKLEPRQHGGDQEGGRRAGTLNVPGIVGMAAAMNICLQKMDEEARIQASWRDALIDAVLALPGAVLNGPREGRLPNNAHFSFSHADSEELVAGLDMAGFALSQGSACTQGRREISHVLKAIGLIDDLARGALRVSLGRFNSPSEITSFVQELSRVLAQCRKRSSIS